MYPPSLGLIPDIMINVQTKNPVSAIFIAQMIIELIRVIQMAVVVGIFILQSGVFVQRLINTKIRTTLEVKLT